ncbi:MAG: hypothetical protein ACYSUT_02425 [Planctomycetota bacterium]|jgi:hypothetical protein
MNRQQNTVKKVSMGLQNVSPKTMAAITLVTLMAILWGRVLLKGKTGPQNASAAQQQQSVDEQAQLTQSTETAVQIVSVPLEVLPGRHDRLTNNLFSAENWKAYEFHEKEPEAVVEVEVQAPKIDPAEQLRKKHQANLDKIAATLTLEAVILDADEKPSKAFVNNKVLSVGTVLTEQEGPETYELTLTELTKKEALFTWNEFSLVLRITQTENP